MKASQRPVFLNLWRIKFPIPAIISILHRISGVVIFIGLPLLLYILAQSLHSQDSFEQLSTLLANPGMKFLLWIICSATATHFLAGVRHLLMDCGVGEGLRGARSSAYVVIFLSAVAIILLGVWIWS